MLVGGEIGLYCTGALGAWARWSVDCVGPAAGGAPGLGGDEQATGVDVAEGAARRVGRGGGGEGGAARRPGGGYGVAAWLPLGLLRVPALAGGLAWRGVAGRAEPCRAAAHGPSRVGFGSESVLAGAPRGEPRYSQPARPARRCCQWPPG